MKFGLLVSAALMAASLAASAADVKPSVLKKRVLLDLSSEALMDPAGARAILSEAIPERAWKLYPASKWGWVSQVEGGFTPAKICVVTARVMLAPLTITNGLILRPAKRATVFDALPSATQEQCRQLAKDKLREAADVVVSSVVKS